MPCRAPTLPAASSTASGELARPAACVAPGRPRPKKTRRRRHATHAQTAPTSGSASERPRSAALSKGKSAPVFFPERTTSRPSQSVGHSALQRSAAVHACQAGQQQGHALHVGLMTCRRARPTVYSGRRRLTSARRQKNRDMPHRGEDRAAASERERRGGASIREWCFTEGEIGLEKGQRPVSDRQSGEGGQTERANGLKDGTEIEKESEAKPKVERVS
jgi:hypothetical protein